MFSKSFALIALDLCEAILVYNILELSAFLLSNCKLILKFIVDVLDTRRSHILLDVGGDGPYFRVTLWIEL